jgi:hypothetical protein
LLRRARARRRVRARARGVAGGFQGRSAFPGFQGREGGWLHGMEPAHPAAVSPPTPSPPRPYKAAQGSAARGAGRSGAVRCGAVRSGAVRVGAAPGCDTQGAAPELGAHVGAAREHPQGLPARAARHEPLVVGVQREDDEAKVHEAEQREPPARGGGRGQAAVGAPDAGGRVAWRRGRRTIRRC